MLSAVEPVNFDRGLANELAAAIAEEELDVGAKLCFDHANETVDLVGNVRFNFYKSHPNVSCVLVEER